MKNILHPQEAESQVVVPLGIVAVVANGALRETQSVVPTAAPHNTASAGTFIYRVFRRPSAHSLTLFHQV